jgi:hypothetical protein
LVTINNDMNTMKDWMTGIAVPKLHTKDMPVVNEVSNMDPAARRYPLYSPSSNVVASLADASLADASLANASLAEPRLAPVATTATMLCVSMLVLAMSGRD